MRRIEVGIDLPSDGRRIWYYPGPTEGDVGNYGSTVRITRSDGTKWYACFRSGVSDANIEMDFGGSGGSVILTGGAGYHVDRDDENNWHELPLSPFIRIARLVPEIQSVLLFDWVQAAAYGPQGEKWHTPRLFMDDLEVVAADEDVISLRGAVLGGEEQITLNTKDGSILKGRAFDWGGYALR
jgi:hypothetical protein